MFKYLLTSPILPSNCLEALRQMVVGIKKCSGDKLPNAQMLAVTQVNCLSPSEETIR